MYRTETLYADNVKEGVKPSFILQKNIDFLFLCDIIFTVIKYLGLNAVFFWEPYNREHSIFCVFLGVSMDTMNKMAAESPLKLIVKMSVPIMISMMVQSLYNIVDGIFVTRLSSDAFSAVSLVFPLQNIILAISVGFGVGICSVMSIYLGKKDAYGADCTATVGIGFALIHTAVYTVVGLAVLSPFLSMYTQNQSIHKMGVEYGVIVILFSFGQIMQITFEKIFQATGRMVEVMLLLGVGCIINIILDPILIFGLFGFPRLEVKGAAIATIIGQITAFILYIVVFLKNKGGINISLKYFKPTGELLKKMYGVGIPSAIMMALPSVVVSALNGILISFSEVYVAVLGLYYKFQTFIYNPASGVIQGVRPLISYNYGAKENKRVYKFIHLSNIIIFVFMAAGTVAAVFFPEFIIKIFSSDQTLMQLGKPALRIIGLGFILSGVSVVYTGVFEALAKGRESLIISLLRQFIVLIPAAFVLSVPLGAVGVWMAFPIAETAGFLASLYLNKKIIKEQIG